jgi:hypothetical protein
MPLAEATYVLFDLLAPFVDNGLGLANKLVDLTNRFGVGATTRPKART